MEALTAKPALKAHAESLSVLLKLQTTSVHESLDKRIIRAQPFSSTEGYCQFLKMQYSFHYLVAPLFRSKAVQAFLPDISSGCRLTEVARDCLTMGIDQSELDDLAALHAELIISPQQAIGWLYTIEGSNIGAAFLFKMAKKVGINEHNGASHLAGHMDGRAKHWMAFKAKLDNSALDEAEQQDACKGAQDAFTFVRQQVERLLPACD